MTRKYQCPKCTTTVQSTGLSYTKDEQRTECPNGHDVWRVWNGPESQGWKPNTPGRPYGWSRWAIYPELPLTAQEG